MIDPSGVHVHGLKNYQNAIHIVHTLVGIFYCPQLSTVQFRMCFDSARQNIRISWNAEVIPKALFGGTQRVLHVDGISICKYDTLCVGAVWTSIYYLIVLCCVVLLSYWCLIDCLSYISKKAKGFMLFRFDVVKRQKANNQKRKAKRKRDLCRPHFPTVRLSLGRYLLSFGYVTSNHNPCDFFDTYIYMIE